MTSTAADEAPAAEEKPPEEPPPPEKPAEEDGEKRGFSPGAVFGARQYRTKRRRLYEWKYSYFTLV